MYGMICAITEDELAELSTMNDAAFTARVFGGGGTSLMDDHERTLHIETLWAALDFVLTGSMRDEPASPLLGFLRPGGPGEAIGPDLGHGRARLLAPSEVRGMAEALEAIPRDAIEARLTSPRLSDVYPFAGVEAFGEDAELLAAASRALGAAGAAARSLTAEALVAKIKPSRGARPTSAERADVREALDELRAFLGKVVRDGSGALVSIA
jgi:hypothetical protein